MAPFQKITTTEDMLGDITKVTMPFSDEAEMGILSCIIQDPRHCLDETRTAISPDAFYHQKNRHVYEAILTLTDTGKPVDIVTLTTELRAQGLLEKVGGGAQISEIYTFIPVSAHFPFYLAILKEKHCSRQAVRIGAEIIQMARDSHEDAATVVAETDRLAMQIHTDHDSGQIDTMGSLVAEAFEYIETQMKNPGGIPGLTTGIAQLDDRTGGIVPGEAWIMAGGTSDGKAQPLDAKILTPNGFVFMGEIKVGDFVIGVNGCPVEVLSVYPQGIKEVFRVLTNDGYSTECCDEHLWLTSTWKNRCKKTSEQVRPLSEIRKTLFASGRTRLNHQLPDLAPVQFNSNKTLPMNPWLLGALLGDGCLCAGNIKFTNQDQDIVERVRKCIPDCDIMTCDPNRPIEFRVKRKQRNNQQSETKSIIESLGLLGTDSSTKFIPNEYKLASVEDRIEILRGLFDTDGSVMKGMSVDYSTCSNKLADDVVWIVQSLGGSARIREKWPTCMYKGVKVTGQLSYRIVAKFPKHIIPVWTVKKRKRWTGRTRGGHRFIESVTPIGQKECQCIKVTGGLYVTDGFIVTHNTALAMQVALEMALAGAPGAYYLCESLKVKWTIRLLACLSRVPMKHILRGTLTREMQQQVGVAAMKLQKLPITLRHKPGIEVTKMVADIRMLKRKLGIKWYVGDYLQRISNSGCKGNRQEYIAEISKRLTDVGSELGVGSIVLSQLNREGQVRESDAPTHDADVVITLSVPEEKQNGKMVRNEAKRVLSIGKARNEERGRTINLMFQGEIQRFTAV